MAKKVTVEATYLFDSLTKDYGVSWQEAPYDEPRLVRIREILGVEAGGEKSKKDRNILLYLDKKVVNNLGHRFEAAEELGVNETTVTNYCYTGRTFREIYQLGFEGLPLKIPVDKHGNEIRL